jgi:phosphoglycolate phosphatase
LSAALVRPCKKFKMLSMNHIVFDCDGTLVDTSGFKYSLFPGILELLQELHEQHTLYVWTARGQASTLRILQELKVVHFFHEFSTSDTAPPKPHSGGLKKILDGVDKSSILVIGDTTNDMWGAKSFGVTAIGALWNGEGQAEVLIEAGADYIVSHPVECSKLIRQILKGNQDV